MPAATMPCSRSEPTSCASRSCAGCVAPPSLLSSGTTAMNALQFFQISEVVISTLPQDTSKWVADKLVERVSSAANVPVEHIETPVTAGAGA